MPRGTRREQPSTDEQQKARALNRWENEGGAKAKAPRRPHDLNQRAKGMVDIATGEVQDASRRPRKKGKTPPL
jgi:hypothetical protein